MHGQKNKSTVLHCEICSINETFLKNIFARVEKTIHQFFKILFSICFALNRNFSSTVSRVWSAQIVKINFLVTTFFPSLSHPEHAVPPKIWIGVISDFECIRAQFHQTTLTVKFLAKLSRFKIIAIYCIYYQNVPTF